MTILAVDTSGNVCSAAVLKDGRVLSEIYIDNKKTHSEMLGPMVDDVLKAAGMAIHDMDLYACAIGPGSFTGLRIGTAMIKAFAHASGRPAIGVNTLDALSYNISCTDARVCPIIDARRGEVYTAAYQAGERVTDYRALPLNALLAECCDKETIFLGDAAVGYEETILCTSHLFCIAQRGIVLQRAASVALVAFDLYSKGIQQDAFGLEPFYLRETQAERMLKARERDGR